MKISLSKLAKEGIEAHLGDAEMGARAAMLRYADRLDSGRPPLPPPRFLHDRVASETAAALESELLELELATEAHTTLEREAERREVPLDRIASHAVLAYLAELDAVGAVCELPPTS